MAFRFGDPGGRIYTSLGTSNANILAYWTNTSSIVSIVGSGGRTTGSCIRLAYTSGSTALIKTLDSQTTWGIAFAFKCSVAPVTSPIPIVHLLDNKTAQVELRLLQDLTLLVSRNATTLGTTTVALSVNAWYHIEWKTLIDSSAGTSEIRINGVSVLSLSSQNTKNSSNSTANQVALGSSTTVVSGRFPINLDYDDIIVWDGQTTDAAGNSDIHDFIGDCGLTWFLPSGAGTTTQFTPDSGSNYARVNEATPDSNTSYVESSTVNQIDTYVADDLSATAASVKSLALCHFAEKTDSGSRQLVATLRTASTNYTHATGIDLANSYLYYFRSWGSNPNTTIAWTVSEVNGLEIGQKVSA